MFSLAVAKLCFLCLFGVFRGRRAETNTSFKLPLGGETDTAWHLREEGANTFRPSSSRLHLHMYGAEHNSGAPGLSAPAVRTECLLFSLQMSSLATPRHLLLPAGWGRTGQGWEESEGLVSTVLQGGWVRSGWFGPVLGRREGGGPDYLWYPASCCRDYYLLAGTWWNFGKHSTKTGDQLCLGAAAEPPALPLKWNLHQAPLLTLVTLSWTGYKRCLSFNVRSSAIESHSLSLSLFTAFILSVGL